MIRIRSDLGYLWGILAVLVAVVCWLGLSVPVFAQTPGDEALFFQFMPWVGQQVNPTEIACHTIPGSNFNGLTTLPPPIDHPPAKHADMNLALRGYELVEAEDDYVWLDGPTDIMAPQLASLFAPTRRPVVSATHQVYGWDWECNCRTEVINFPDVTLISAETSIWEPLYVPESGYIIGDGYEVLVLYAESNRITLKYTREDNVVVGYTLHIEGVCVESSLLELYLQYDEAGRRELPALVAGQAFARAKGETMQIAIRDTGSFMDPRSLKDWWR